MRPHPATGRTSPEAGEREEDHPESRTATDHVLGAPRQRCGRLPSRPSHAETEPPRPVGCTGRTPPRQRHSPSRGRGRTRTARATACLPPRDRGCRDRAGMGPQASLSCPPYRVSCAANRLQRCRRSRLTNGPRGPNEPRRVTFRNAGVAERTSTWRVRSAATSGKGRPGPSCVSRKGWPTMLLR